MRRPASCADGDDRALLEAMIPRVKAIETGEPTVALNNTIYAFASLPAAFEPLA